MTSRERQDVLRRAWAVRHTCLHVEPCSLLAGIDQHTGIAAGVAYRNGRESGARAGLEPANRNCMANRR